MLELLRKGKVLLIVGNGGVGKTTVSAALALAGALEGLDTAVMTVDPARRLRDALEMGKASNRPLHLDSRHLQAAGLPASLPIAAMVLEVKGIWDSLVRRSVASPAARARILANRFYQSLTSSFAGADIYAALDRLYEIHESRRFELEVVDTPPVSHALELFEAPEHLLQLLDTRSVRWLVGARQRGTTPLALRLANRAARFVALELERFAGASTLTSILDFFADASEALDAISSRFHAIRSLLHSRLAGFVLVTTPEEDRLKSTEAAVKALRANRLRPKAVVVNRFLDEILLAQGDELTHGFSQFLNLVGGLSQRNGEPGLLAEIGAPLRFLEKYGAGVLEQVERVRRFSARLPAGVRVHLLPRMRVEPSDLGSIARLAELLRQESPALHSVLATKASVRGGRGQIPGRGHSRAAMK